MPEFTYEIFAPEELLISTDVLKWRDGERNIWCAVEDLALRFYEQHGQIRVRNSEGEIVVQTGISAALSSIGQCTCASCPLKTQLAAKRWSRNSTCAEPKRPESNIV